MLLPMGEGEMPKGENVGVDEFVVVMLDGGGYPKPWPLAARGYAGGGETKRGGGGDTLKW